MASLQISIPDFTRSEDESWKQKCEEKLKKLEEDFTRSEDEDANALRLRKFQEEYETENISMDFEIYRAIKDGDPNKFIDVLEGVWQRGKLRLFEVLNQFTHGGDSMLHVAAKCGSEKIAELVACHHPDLLEKVNAKGNTALHEAARSKKGGSNVIKVILSQHDTWQGTKVKDITRSANRVGNTALHEAVACGCLDGVTELYHKDKAVTHQLNKAKKSPLYMAVYNYMHSNSNTKEIINCLLQDSLLENKPNPPWSQGKSPLHAAIKAISDKKREQWLPGLPSFVRRCLMFYKFRAPTDLFEELVNKRPEMMYLKDEDGRTPLHYAARYGYLHGVRIMLKKNGPAALKCDVFGDLPIHLACKYGRIDVVKELLQVDCPYVEGLVNQRGQNILHVAAMSGQHDVVKYILKGNMNINLNETDVDGNTPLHLASKNTHPMVLFHLTREESIDLQYQTMYGLMARDILLKQLHRPMTYRELLSHAILSTANAKRTKKGRKELQPNHGSDCDLNLMKELANTLILVAILIATVTFAAAFTVPGSVYGSDDPNPLQRGTAILANRTAFQIFMVCNTIAMFSSSFGSFLLLLAQIGDYHLASCSFKLAFYLVALALICMYEAFVCAAQLVVYNVSWLASLITVIEIMFIPLIGIAGTLFVFPLEIYHHPLLFQAFVFPLEMFLGFLFHLLEVMKSRLPEKKSKTSDSEQGNVNKDSKQENVSMDKNN